MSRVVINTNVEQALQQLEQAGVNVAQVKRDAVPVAGDVLLAKAREYAPSPSSSMYPTASSGQLRDSHTLAVTDNQAVVQPQVYYAVYVHEGHFTAVKYVKGHKPAEPKWIAGRPWLYHAAMDSRDEIAQEIQVLVQSALVSAVEGTTGVG